MNKDYISRERIVDFGEIYTPVEIVDRMINLFDAADFEKTWYEPTCGNGRFVTAIARRMLSLGHSTDEIAARIKATDILDDNIAATKLALIDVIGDHPAIHTNIYQCDALAVIKSKKIKADIVIGNPPYQYPPADKKEHGMSRAIAAYPDFILAIMEFIKPSKLSMIIPSRYLYYTGIGAGIKKLADFVRNCGHIKHMTHFSQHSYPFVDVEIKGGTNYFLFDKSYKGFCELEVNGFVEHVDLSSSFFSLLPNSYPIINHIHSNFKKMVTPQSCNVFGVESNQKPDTKSSSTIECFGKRQQYFDVELNKIRNLQLLKKWKVVGLRIRDPLVQASIFFIVPPNKIVSQTYVVLSLCDSKTDAENIQAYLSSPEVRYLLRTKQITPNIKSSCFGNIPYPTGFSQGMCVADYLGLDDAMRDIIADHYRSLDNGSLTNR